MNELSTKKTCDGWSWMQARKRKAFEVLYKVEWLTRSTSLHPFSTTDYILLENSSAVTDTLTEGI